VFSLFFLVVAAFLLLPLLRIPTRRRNISFIPLLSATVSMR
jgi:hypothetical protein